MNEEQIREKASIAYMKWLSETHPEVIENEDEYEEYSNGLVEGWYGGYEISTKELQKENEQLKKKLVQTQDAVTMQMYTNKANKEQSEMKIAHLEKQIEKMKCCQNCKYFSFCPRNCANEECCNGYDKWELAEN